MPSPVARISMRRCPLPPGCSSLVLVTPAAQNGWSRCQNGFADVAFTDVHEPVYYGPAVAAALDWIRGFACTNNVLKQLDPAAAARAAGRLREALAAHLSDDGAWFTPRARIVTAHRHRDRTSPRSQLNDQPETASAARSQAKKRRHTVTSAGWCHRAWNRRYGRLSNATSMHGITHRKICVGSVQR